MFNVHVHGTSDYKPGSLHILRLQTGAFQNLVYCIQNGIFNCTRHRNIIALPRDNIWKLPRLTRSVTTWNTETSESSRMGPLWRKGDERARGWTTCRRRGGKGSQDQYPGPEVYPPRGLGLRLPVKGRGCAKVTNHTTKYKHIILVWHELFATITINTEQCMHVFCPEDRCSTFLWHVDNDIPDHTVSSPIRQ